MILEAVGPSCCCMVSVVCVEARPYPRGEHSTVPFVFPSRTAGRVRGSGLSWPAFKACLPSWPTHSVGPQVYDGRATWAKASAGGSRGFGPLRKRARIRSRQSAVGEALHELHAFMRMLMHLGVVRCSAKQCELRSFLLCGCFGRGDGGEIEDICEALLMRVRGCMQAGVIGTASECVTNPEGTWKTA